MTRYYAELIKLENDKKKYLVIVLDRLNNIKRTLKFGDSKYEDYTTMKYKDFTRKLRYRIRHSGDNINNPMMPGFWSYWILWNKKTIKDSIKDTEKRYSIIIN